MAAEVRLAGAMLAQDALVRTQACAEQVPQGGDDHRIRRPPGFVDRRGYRLFNPDIRWIHHWERHPVLRRISIEMALSQYDDLDGRLETRTLDFQTARFDLQAGDIIESHLTGLSHIVNRCV